jgi:hypothetical protein
MMTLGGFVFGRSARDLDRLDSIFFCLNPCKFQIFIVSLHPEHLNNDDYGSNDNKKTAHYALHELLS